MKNLLIATGIFGLSGLTGCAKPEPIAFQVIIKTHTNITTLVVPTQGGIICSKGLPMLPNSTTINTSSEDKPIQIGNITSAQLWNRTHDGRYTIGKDIQGNIVFRLININGNGTTALYNEDDIKGATLKSCSE